VEEIVYRKAASKLQLTNMVIEGGHFTPGAQKPSAEADFQVRISSDPKAHQDKEPALVPVVCRELWG
jgi:hypothetical protein